jgi:hypothetical protein
MYVYQGWCEPLWGYTGQLWSSLWACLHFRSGVYYLNLCTLNIQTYNTLHMQFRTLCRSHFAGINYFVGWWSASSFLDVAVSKRMHLVALPKCVLSCCSAKVHAVLLQCQSVCSLVAVPKFECRFFAVPKCMQSCCSAKVYVCTLQSCCMQCQSVCMHYAVLLQCQSVRSLVTVPKCMQSCWSAKVYALCSLVAVPKCMHYAVLLQCQSVCRFVAVPENLQFLQRGVSRSQRLLWPDHRRHLPLRGQQIPLQEVTTILCRSLN